jgi:hypothetical protein
MHELPPTPLVLAPRARYGWLALVSIRGGIMAMAVHVVVPGVTQGHTREHYDQVRKAVGGCNRLR